MGGYKSHIIAAHRELAAAALSISGRSRYLGGLKIEIFPRAWIAWQYAGPESVPSPCHDTKLDEDIYPGFPRLWGVR